jgi:ABC-type multidrug transport system fused ATPase/permease subunit
LYLGYSQAGRNIFLLAIFIAGLGISLNELR